MGGAAVRPGRERFHYFISDTTFIGVPQRAFADAPTAELFAASVRSRFESAQRSDRVGG